MKSAISLSSPRSGERVSGDDKSSIPTRRRDIYRSISKLRSPTFSHSNHRDQNHRLTWPFWCQARVPHYPDGVSEPSGASPATSAEEAGADDPRGDLKWGSIPGLVRDAADRFGNREAVVDGDLRLSFFDLAARALEVTRAAIRDRDRHR